MKAYDTIYGGKDNDTLTGGKDHDILYGDLGNDSLIGGSGNDIFVLKAGYGFDTIGDFNIAEDRIGLTGGLTFSQLDFTENERGTIIKNLLTGEQLAVTLGLSKSAITSASFSADLGRKIEVDRGYKLCDRFPILPVAI